QAAKSNAQNRKLQTSRRRSFFNRKGSDRSYGPQQELQHQPGKMPRYRRQTYSWEKALVGLFMLSITLVAGAIFYYVFS
ncbi:MAG: hypothetical protein AAF433_23150, partial [Bacteroidota bacterium]